MPGERMFEQRDLVLPGDLLARGDFKAGDNAYKVGDEIRASRLGLVEYGEDEVSVIALKSCYDPKVGDVVVGKVVDVNINGWDVDIGGPLEAFLNVKDVIGGQPSPEIPLTRIYDIGDVIVAKIVGFHKTSMRPLLTTQGPGLGKVGRGLMIRITPTKIPRVIGKKGSMISMLLKETRCKLILGQNGYIIAIGSKRGEEMVAAALDKIERECHVPGLTDRVQEFIRSLKGEGEKVAAGG